MYVKLQFMIDVKIDQNRARRLWAQMPEPFFFTQQSLFYIPGLWASEEQFENQYLIV